MRHGWLAATTQPASSWPACWTGPCEAAPAIARRGRFIVHDAAAVGCLLWPELFLSAQLAIKICLDGAASGKCQPVPRREASRQPVSVLTSVQAADFLENMFEVLCSQRFVV